jgi:hypothetical protein
VKHRVKTAEAAAEAATIYTLRTASAQAIELQHGHLRKHQQRAR